MPNISYVYPNIGPINRNNRNGLLNRWVSAKKHGCQLVELPAHFISSKKDMELTGLHEGGMLTPKAISKVYLKDNPADISDIKYIMHTEYIGGSNRNLLRWHDEAWVKSFVQMQVNIAKHLGLSPFAIEIHPGYKDTGDGYNEFWHLEEAIKLLLTEFIKEFKRGPLILLENRTDQLISTGKDLMEFWDSLSTENKEKTVGIVLDVQQLFTATRNKFDEELEVIPLECIKAYHIHQKHNVPNADGEIPWEFTFKRNIKKIKSDLLINPEVHHGENIDPTIDFCKSLLK